MLKKRLSRKKIKKMRNLLIILIQLLLCITAVTSLRVSKNSTTCPPGSQGKLACPEGFEQQNIINILNWYKIRGCFSKCPPKYHRFGIYLCMKKDHFMKFKQRKKIEELGMCFK